MWGEFRRQELDVSALCCFRKSTAPLHGSPCTPDIFATFSLAPLTTELCNMVISTLAYFLFLDIPHCPSGLHFLLFLCGSGIHVNYNKWKFLGILQDILCFFSHTNLWKLLKYERQSHRWFKSDCNFFVTFPSFFVSFSLWYIVISRKFHSPCLIVSESLDNR